MIVSVTLLDCTCTCTLACVCVEHGRLTVRVRTKNAGDVCTVRKRQTV